MAERAAVNETFRVSLEANPGTVGTIWRRFQSTDIDPSPEVATRGHRGTGRKANVARTVGFDWTTAKVEGPINFNELVWLLSAHFGAPTFSGNTATWLPAMDAADTPKTLSVHKGGAIRAEGFLYGVLQSMQMQFDLSEPTFNGDLFGRAMTEGVTLASGTALTTPACVPLSEAQWEVNFGTAVDLSDLALLTRVKSFNFQSQNKWAPGFFANSAQSSFTAEVEKAPEMSAELGVELDANGSALMAHVRTAAKRVCQLKAVGPGGATAYAVYVEFPCNVTQRRRSTVDDLEVGTYTLEPIYDGAFGSTATGGYLRVRVVSDQTALA